MSTPQKSFQKKNPVWGWVGGALLILFLNAFFVAFLQLAANPINVFGPPRGPNRGLQQLSEMIGLLQSIYFWPLAFLSFWKHKKNFLKGLFLGAGITVVGNLLYLCHSFNLW